MGRNWFRATLLAGVIALIVVACGGPPPPPPPSGLFGDDELAAATELSVTDLTTLQSNRSIDLRPGAPASRRSAVSGASVLPQQQGEDAPAKVATVEQYADGDGTEYRVVLFEDGEPPADGEVVFLGTTPIESAATDTEGGIMLVSAGSDAAGYDVYVFDIAGVLGDAETVYRLPDTSDEETDVSMSLDGTVWGHHSTDDEGLGSAILYYVDSGQVFRDVFEIALSNVRYDMKDPSVAGDGGSLVFVFDTIPLDGSERIIQFFVADGGAVLWTGDELATTALRDPSLSIDGSILVFEEIFDGDEYVSWYDTFNDVLEDVVVNDGDDLVDHPHVSGGADVVVYSLDGVPTRAALTFTEEGMTVDTVEIPTSADGAVVLAPYIARTPPPPPPPPPGTEVYEGTTVDGPLWDRPDGETTVGPMPYHAHEFTADVAGVYDIQSEQDYDGYLLLYQAPFDPEAPFDNLLASNDDDPGTGFSRIRMFLDTGDYVVVTTSCGPEGSPTCGPAAGSFTNMIIPPQELPEDAEPRIDIFNVDLSVAATSEQIEATWYVASPLPITCTIDWGDGNVDPVACEGEVVGTATHSYSTEGPMVVVFTATNDNGSAVAKAFPTIHNDDPGSFDIVVVFANDLLTETQMAAFENAAARWAEVITADLPAAQPDDVPADFSCFGEPPFNGAIDDIVISAAGQIIDGPGQVLARAGPCLFRSDDSNDPLFPLPIYGIMQFDVADLEDLEAEGGLFSTILHEMGHVLGIGPLWGAMANDLIDYEPAGTACNQVPPGTGAPSQFTELPVFTGEEATTQHELLGGTGGPLVEDQYGPGTQCSHWDEETYATELMTGFTSADGSVEPLSAITIGSLQDIGYTVDMGEAEPYEIPATEASIAPASLRRIYDITGIFGKHGLGQLSQRR